VWGIIFLLLSILFLLIPRNTADNRRDKEDYLDELLYLDEEEDDLMLEEYLMLMDEEDDEDEY
jgi:hypothetical protein